MAPVNPMQTPLSILLVEDDAGEAERVRGYVAAGLAGSTIRHEERLAEAETALGTSSFDVVLLDLTLPDAGGLEALERLMAVAGDTPVIVMPELVDSAVEWAAFDRGASDCLPKGETTPGLLARSIRYGVERARRGIALRESRAEQIRFKTEFLSHVSHELRSPLTAIKQFASILVSGLAGELNDQQREYQEIVLKNVQQLQTLIDDLLDVTRLEGGKITIDAHSLSVQEAAADALNTVEVTAREKGVTLSCELPSDLPAAYADHIRVVQVLINLLDNAVKFTPTGGTVRIRARPLDEDPGFLLVEVSDTGCGISPEVSEKLFERLYQAPAQVDATRKGLGLGLHICKELVKRQGGEIRVTSEPGKGSTFSFTLPRFSLGESIAPLIRNGKWPAASVALLTAEFVHPGEPSSRERRLEWSLAAHSLIRRCLLPDLDLLLPGGRSTANGIELHVAVFADDHGMSVLVNRIHEQYHRFGVLAEAGLKMSVAYTMLPPFEQEVGSAMEEAVAAMAGLLEEAIESRKATANTLS